MKTYHNQLFYYFRLHFLFLCFIFLTSTALSCKEKQKPPDFKKDTSSTVLFNKDSSHPVSVERMVRSSFQRFIISRGIVKIGPKFPVNSMIGGRVGNVTVEEGQSVGRDQIICELDQTPILLDLQYQATIIEYQRERLEDFRDKDAMKSREARELAYLLQAEETRQKILENRRENTRIKSPVDGRIQRLFIQPGEVVVKGGPIALVIDISQVTVIADAHQEDLPHLKKGTRVEIRLVQDPRQVFLGEIVRVALEADPETHRFGLEISLVNLQEKFLPGMAVQIKIRGPFMKNVLLVDKSAVREQQGESYLFVLKGSSAALRSVILGPESDGKLIVRSGVKEGEQIITSPSAGLADGDTVEISQ